MKDTNSEAKERLNAERKKEGWQEQNEITRVYMSCTYI